MLTAAQAKNYIKKQKVKKKITKSQLKKIEHLKVDYKSVHELPQYKLDKLNVCINYIVKKYKPNNIYLVKSQLNGYPVNEFTTVKDFNKLKSVFKNTKLSDWDFIVDTIERFQIIEHITPLLKIDLFKFHHNNVKKLLVYENI